MPSKRMFASDFKSARASASSSPSSDGIEEAVDPELRWGDAGSARPRRYLTLQDENGDPIRVLHPAEDYADEYAQENSLLQPSKRLRLGESSAAAGSSSSAAAYAPVYSGHQLDEKELCLSWVEAMERHRIQQERDFKIMEARMSYLKLQSEKDGEDDSEEAKRAKAEATKFAGLPLAERILKLSRQLKETEMSNSLSQRLITKRAFVFDPNCSKQLSGEARYQRVLQNIEAITAANGFSLETAQRLFVREYLFACTPLVYGSDWKESSMQFLQKNKLAKIQHQVMALTPRRFGKTVSVCVFVLAMILSVPKLRVIVISQVKRSSVALVKKIKEYLWNLPGGKERLASDSTERIEVIPEEDASQNLTMVQKKNHPAVSSVIGLPSTVDGKQSFIVCFGSSSAGQKDRRREREKDKEPRGHSKSQRTQVKSCVSQRNLSLSTSLSFFSSTKFQFYALSLPGVRRS